MPKIHSAKITELCDNLRGLIMGISYVLRTSLSQGALALRSQTEIIQKLHWELSEKFHYESLEEAAPRKTTRIPDHQLSRTERKLSSTLFRIEEMLLNIPVVDSNGKEIPILTHDFNDGKPSILIRPFKPLPEVIEEIHAIINSLHDCIESSDTKSNDSDGDDFLEWLSTIKVDLEHNTVTLGDGFFAFKSHRAAEVFQMILEGRGGFVPSTTMRDYDGEKIDRIIKSFPEPIIPLVEGLPGAGYRIVRPFSEE